MQTFFARVGARWGLLAPDGRFVEIQEMSVEAHRLYEELIRDMIEYTMNGDFRRFYLERARKLREMSPHLFHELEREVTKSLYPLEGHHHIL